MPSSVNILRGASFLLAEVPRNILSCSLGCYFAVYLLSFVYDRNTWLSLLHRTTFLGYSLITLCFIPTVVLALTLEKLSTHSLIRSMNAQEFPAYDGKFPGNIDLLMELFRGFREGRPHQFIGEIMENFAPTLQTSLLGLTVVRLSALSSISRRSTY